MKLVNVEIKARCQNPERVRELLRGRNARFAGTDHQIDTYFRVPEGRLKLRRGNIENALIAYRRPDQAGPKQSEVVLAAVSNGDEMRAVLARALEVLVEVDKRREIYYLENIKFHVDVVEGLGGFVEIEACGPSEADRDRLTAQCREFMEVFGIREEELIEKSYSDLVLEHAVRGS